MMTFCQYLVDAHLAASAELLETYHPMNSEESLEALLTRLSLGVQSLTSSSRLHPKFYQGWVDRINNEQEVRTELIKFLLFFVSVFQ